jgi:hypothetical protein
MGLGTSRVLVPTTILSSGSRVVNGMLCPSQSELGQAAAEVARSRARPQVSLGLCFLLCLPWSRSWCPLTFTPGLAWSLTMGHATHPSGGWSARFQVPGHPSTTTCLFVREYLQ